MQDITVREVWGVVLGAFGNSRAGSLLTGETGEPAQPDVLTPIN